MPVVRFAVLSSCTFLMTSALAFGGVGCGAAAASVKADAPRPLGLPDDFDLEAERRSVRGEG
jgi:hypothetical protein